MNYAELPRQEKSLVMASNHESLQFDEGAANTRRFFGSRRRSGRRDALISGKQFGPMESDEGLDARGVRESKETRGG